MAIVWGVDQDAVQARYPQIDIAASAPLTDARLTVLIQASASELEAVIRSQYGPSAAQAIEDEDGATSRRCAQIVLVLMGPDLFRAAHYQEVPLDITEQADTMRENLQRRPTLSIGYLPTGDAASATTASTHGMSTSTQSRESRRRFDGRANGKTSGGWSY